MVERGRKSSLLLLIRALTHPEGPISWPNDLPKPKTITLGLEFQWTDPEGHKHSVHCSLEVEGVSGGRNVGQEEAILGEEQEQSSRMGACLGGLNSERASCPDRRSEG